MSLSGKWRSACACACLFLSENQTGLAAAYLFYTANQGAVLRLQRFLPSH